MLHQHISYLWRANRTSTVQWFKYTVKATIAAALTGEWTGHLFGHNLQLEFWLTYEQNLLVWSNWVFSSSAGQVFNWSTLQEHVWAHVQVASGTCEQDPGHQGGGMSASINNYITWSDIIMEKSHYFLEFKMIAIIIIAIYRLVRTSSSECSTLLVLRSSR